MKPTNVRLAYINSLVALIKEHISTYGTYRKRRAPEMSIHGKDQNISIVFHGPAQSTIGELTLFCPKNDSDPDNLDVSNLLKTKVLEDWQEWTKGLKFNKRDDKRDLWCALDVMHMMSLLGFTIKAGVETFDSVHVTGHLTPNSSINHGRFNFWFNGSGGGSNAPYFSLFGDVQGELKGEYQFVEKQAVAQNFTEETNLANREVDQVSPEDIERTNALLASRNSLEELDQGYTENIGVDELHYDMDTVVDGCELTSAEEALAAERLRKLESGESEAISIEEMERRLGLDDMEGEEPKAVE